MALIESPLIIPAAAAQSAEQSPVGVHLGGGTTTNNASVRARGVGENVFEGSSMTPSATMAAVAGTSSMTPRGVKGFGGVPQPSAGRGQGVVAAGGPLLPVVAPQLPGAAVPNAKGGLPGDRMVGSDPLGMKPGGGGPQTHLFPAAVPGQHQQMQPAVPHAAGGSAYGLSGAVVHPGLRQPHGVPGVVPTMIPPMGVYHPGAAPVPSGGSGGGTGAVPSGGSGGATAAAGGVLGEGGPPSAWKGAGAAPKTEAEPADEPRKIVENKEEKASKKRRRSSKGSSASYRGSHSDSTTVLVGG
eukprot:g5982.t1